MSLRAVSNTITGGSQVGGTISGATIDNSVIGGTTPVAGTFTTLISQTENLSSSGRQIINNNAATPTNINAGVSYLGYTGTNLATLTINFPAGAAGIDGLIITVYFSAAVGTALTLASSGATFVDAPATVAAKTRVSYIYNNASTQWLPR